MQEKNHEARQARTRLHCQQSGKGMVRAFVWLGLLCVFLYICRVIAPIYIANYQFEDALRNEARFAVAEHRDETELRAEVFRAAGELGMPVTPEEIEVEPIIGGYRITVRYTVKVEIFRHDFELHLSPTADSNSV